MYGIIDRSKKIFKGGDDHFSISSDHVGNLWTIPALEEWEILMISPFFFLFAKITCCFIEINYIS